MPLIAVKLLLAPCFVLLASLTGRRFGPRAAGLIGGLPVVGGPILFIYALEHGGAFAAAAAGSALLGLVSLVGFVVVYGRLARRCSPWASLLGGWTAFFALTLAFSLPAVPAPLALAILAGVIVLALRLLPEARAQRVTAPMPGWDLPLRAACAIVLVLALTAAASSLGPRLSGLLAPFPVLASVLVGFTHAQHGRRQLLGLLRGLVSGYGGFALFAFTLAELLPVAPARVAFMIALAASVLCQATLFTLSASALRREQAADRALG